MIFTLITIFLSFVIIFFILQVIFCPLRWFNPKNINYFDSNIPGSTGLPLLGHALDLAALKQEDLLVFLEKITESNPRFVKLWIAGTPFLILRDPEDLEVAMSSMLHIQKGIEYHFMEPWLNEGLLLSNGDKWRFRRKMLTPTFHFKILEDNAASLNKHSRSMVQNILSKNGESFEVNEVTHLCTLDIICETAMGINLNDQHEEGQEYVNAIQKVAKYTVERTLTIWLYRLPIFNLTSLATKFYKYLKILHSFTDRVIRERKQCYLENTTFMNEKKRKAFLDCLIEMEIKNPGSFSDSDIREEVDTFMFEGHDTTSAALNFALYELGRNPEIQEKAYQEQFEIFGDSDRDVNVNDLTKMVYLETIIKETLRIHPSVPFMTRYTTHELKLKDMVLAPGLNIIIVPHSIHRNPDIYPDPLVFDPDRFAPDESSKRHPYAYIPFSAGPRNCIGQRFAMMELKTILSYVLRFTKLESVTRPEDFKYLYAFILRTVSPLKIKATKRVC